MAELHPKSHPPTSPMSSDSSVRSGVHLISVQKVTVRASPQSEDWRGVCSRGERKCLSRFEFLLVS